jgi:serine/threonine-protein kinase
MATVYLAHDLKHDRLVAIKVLGEDLSAARGAERFEREIAVTARLQHSHILPLFDSGHANGLLYYVMPFVEGETLRQRMDRERQLGVADTLSILADVAAALQYAHGRGVIHRDVKPENILLHEGRAVIADFGIAAPVNPAERERLTQTGMALGTPSYMSPEQASGDRALDGRTDIYSLGAVAYEMLAGAPPHTGPTNQAIVARLLTEVPTPLSVLRPDTPPSVERAIARTLAKAPADRFASADEFARALREPDPREITRRHAAPRRTTIVLATAVALLAVAAIAVALSGVWRRRGELRPGRVTHLTRDPGLELDPALSPDGKSVAYAAGEPGDMRIFVRQLAGGQAVAIARATNENQRWPQWSPDGTRIAFYVGRAEDALDPRIPANAIYVAGALGGGERRLLADSASDVTPAWSPDGKRIAYARGNGVYATALYVADADSDSPPRKIVEGNDVYSPRWSPDGSMLAYVSGNPRFTLGTAHLGNDGPSSIWVVTLSDGKPHRITPGTWLDVSPVWMPDSRSLLFVSNRGGSRDVYRVPITRHGEADGAPVRVTSGINAQGIDLTRDGRTLSYSAYLPYSHIWSAPLPRSGETNLGHATQLTTADETIEGIALSTDGKWLAYDSDRSGNGDIWKIPVAGGQAVQLTTNPSGDYVQDWSFDDAEIAFHSYRGGIPQIYVMNADGTGTTRVTPDGVRGVNPEFSPDANTIAYDMDSIFTISRARRGAAWGAPVPLLGHAGSDASWSPDGRYIAYAWSGIHLTSPSGRDDHVLVPATPDFDPQFAYWARDSRTVYFKAYDASGRSSIWAIPVSGGQKRLLMRFDDLTRPSARREFATDGTRLYFTVAQQESDLWLMELTSK